MFGLVEFILFSISVDVCVNWDLLDHVHAIKGKEDKREDFKANFTYQILRTTLRVT